MKRPSPTRFFIWLPLFAASGAAFLMLSQGWFVVGLLLMSTGNFVLQGGFLPSREYPAAKLTTRELFFFAAGVLLIWALVYYLAVVGPFTLPSIPTPSPSVARVAIAIFWAAVVAYQWRRTFSSAAVAAV